MPHEVRNTTKEWADLMNVVCSQIQGCLRAGRAAGLTTDAVALAAFIAAYSYSRTEGVNEENTRKLAASNVPLPRQYEEITGKPRS